MKSILLLSLIFAGCASMSSSNRSETVRYVDLKRYMGRWYVIANVPYLLEKGKVATFDSYAPRPDGSMSNNFTFRKSLDGPEKTWHGKATVVNTETNAEWKVSFIWPISSTYLVLDLDPDYQWAVVGTPNKKLFWILSRDTHLADSTYTLITKNLGERGYDISKLTKVPQAN